MQLILLHHHVEIGIFRQTCIHSETCSFDTLEDADIYMTGFYNFCIGTESDFFCQRFHLCCLFHRQSLLREKTIVLFVSDHCHCCQRLLCHDWNYMSLLWNIVHLPSTKKHSLSHFPLQVGFLSLLTLGDCSSFHNFVPNPEVSTSHHLTNLKFYRCLQS